MPEPTDRDRLPGGLALWRARRALRRARKFAIPYEGGGIDASGQPALLRLVEDVAWYVDARPPDRVGLRGFGGVFVDVRDGRTELLLPVPTLLVQPADEIRSLVAHELATVHPVESELVAQLYRLPDDADDDLLTRIIEGRSPTSYRVLRTVRGLFTELEARADAAASRIAGARHAAIAQIKESRLSVDCRNMVNDVEAELSDGGCTAGLVDVFTLWLDRLRRYGPEYPMSAHQDWRERMAGRHPGLADALAQLRPDELDLGQGGPLVDLVPFSADEARALAVDAFVEQHDQWMSAAEVPDSVWQAAIKAEGIDTLEAIAELADREPDGVADAMAATCALQYYDEDNKQERLVELAEYALVPRGWRRAHPGQPGVLTDPSGTEHDLRPTVRQAVADPRALAELTRLVGPSDR
jgi:hypothetical protein